MTENILLMPFLDESPSFVNGFEAGKIWEQLKNGETIENLPIHLSNKEQIKEMCKLFNCNYEIEDADYGWCYLTVKSIIEQ